jgi:hypothetical protein
MALVAPTAKRGTSPAMTIASRFASAVGAAPPTRRFLTPRYSFEFVTKAMRLLSGDQPGVFIVPWPP